MFRHYSLSAYFRRRFGRRIRKIPLDAGASCPNRDGTLSLRGCSFCNELGSGTGQFGRGVDLEGQWEAWRARSRNPEGPFLAYLQSFSNTHCSPERLRGLLARLAALPALAGVAVGTRPDCLDEERLDVLADAGVDEFWLDLGLQSADDAVLAGVNRGHTAGDFARAARAAAGRGLKVCAHLVAGLPGEREGGFEASVEFVSALPVAGIKLHNLYVCKGAPLARDFLAGDYAPLEQAAYVEMLARALPRLRPDMVVHRLASDPRPGELLAPDWAARKSEVLRDLAAILKERDVWQGCEAGAPDAVPAWFNPEHPRATQSKESS
ncbi:tRNA modification radical SAM protein MnmL/YtqA [Desulfocurvus sp. DL9XJH121]